LTTTTKPTTDVKLAVLWWRVGLVLLVRLLQHALLLYVTQDIFRLLVMDYQLVANFVVPGHGKLALVTRQRAQINARRASGPVKKDYQPIQSANFVALEHGTLASVSRRRVQIYARRASGPMKKDYRRIQSANSVVLAHGVLALVTHRLVQIYAHRASGPM
jgi:hypothetical protein